jgi:hypothetical protein
METMLGHLEFTLMTGMEEVPGELNDEEHDDAACPAIARLAMNKQDLFAKALMGDVHTWDQTKLFLIQHQWIEDRRKTKAETEERSVQECVIKVFKGMNCMTSKTGTKEEWRNFSESDGGPAENPGGGGHGSRRGNKISRNLIQ